MSLLKPCLKQIKLIVDYCVLFPLCFLISSDYFVYAVQSNKKTVLFVRLLQNRIKKKRS